MADFKSHSLKQDRVWNSDAPLTIVGTGTQWGKSMSAAIWMKRQVHKFTDPLDNFLLLAPTYKVMNQSMLPYFLHVMEGMGHYKETKAEFDMGARRKVYLRTGTDPDSIIGIPNVKAFWLDEAGKATLYFWENIRARAASKGALGLLTTSPYARNWLYKQYIRPKERGLLQEIPIIRAASWENPYHTLHDPEKRAYERSQMDPRRFDMIYGGEWGMMAGLVYSCWDDEANQVDEFKLPLGTIYYGGLDWGFTDPFCFKIRAITPDGRHYGFSEFYRAGLTISQIIELLKQKRSVYPIRKFWCDPSQPGYIKELNDNGLPAEGADNDIRKGVDLHYELIQSRRYKEFRGSCPNSSDERDTYHYPEPEDLGPDDDARDDGIPVDQNNHAMDVDRYLTISTYRRDTKLTPKAPSETPPKIADPATRLEFLKRHAREQHGERWSED